MPGIVDADDVRGVVTDTYMADLVIAADISKPILRITEDESLLSAINLMAKGDARALVVVDHDDEEKPVAILGETDIFTAYRRNTLG